MKQFADSNGQVWPLTVNGYTVKRCRDLLSIDIGEPTSGDPPLLTRLGTDLVFLVDLLYVVCKPKADELGLTDIQFAERLEGDSLQLAYSAWMEEWRDFFQKLRQPHKARAIAEQTEMVARAMAEADKAMASDGFKAMTERKLAALGESFASLLEPAELPQAITHSANSAG